MRATIIADASHCPETKAAGYGFWIASDRGELGGGGEMKRIVESNITAEMQAVANALHIAIQRKLVQHRDQVLIQTDCVAAIEAFTGKRVTLQDHEQDVVKYFKKLRKALSLSIEFRHVKGHTGKKEARFVTNHLCDKRAKEAMRNLRLRINSGIFECLD